MRKILLISLILVFVLQVSVFAKSVKRIIFKRGATKTVVSGRLNDYKGSAFYVIGVRKGQTLHTEQVGDNHITVGIADPNGEEYNDADASCNNYNTVEDTKSGDYKITVFECMKADALRGNFRLLVSIK